MTACRSRPLAAVVACGALLLATGAARPSVARADDADTSIWTKIELPADAGNPDGPADQSQDTVTGIYFKDLDHGLVVANAFHTGGVIYSATATKMTGVAYRGAKHAFDDAQDASFHGCVRQDDGGLLFPLQFGAVVVQCDKDFKFSRSQVGRGDFADQEQLLLRQTAGGKWWLIAGNGVATTDDAPSKGTEWTTLWAPESSPTVPAEIPAGSCKDAPGGLSAKDGTCNSFGYVSPDGMMIAYPCHSAPAVCVSRDGGKAWKAVALPGAPTPKDSTDAGSPSALLFTDKTHGWACGEGGGTPYLYLTADGGQTWTAGKLPDRTMAKGGEFGFRLHSIFFAPDNKAGWIVGREGNGRPLLLRTTDGGATWKDKTGGPHSLVMLTGESCELMTGFALDADHVWVGGRDGYLFYTDKASQ